MAFMQAVFSKNFRSPSSDFIAIFAGLEYIDQVFFDLLDNLSSIIKRRTSKDDPHLKYMLNIQVNSIRTATVAAAGAYQTSLASYFTNRDIFGSIIAFIDLEGIEEYVGDAFSLIGILASYDKLEALNPYRTRLSDFVDHQSMMKSIQSSGHVWQICWERYAVYIGVPARTQNPGLLAYSSVASWLGVGQNVQSTTPKGMESLPLEIISLTLATYEFINANKVYAKLLLESPPAENKAFASSNPPFVNFLSLCTYLFQNQHNTSRATLYARLNLLILRLLVEAPSSSSVTPLLISNELSTNAVNVCRQRTPYLPFVERPRLLIEGILDAIQCSIRYNMKRVLDTEMYTLAFTVLFQIIHLLRASKFGLSYIWSELWKTIMSLIKFVNSHLPEANATPAYIKMGRLITLVLASALIHGDVIFAESSDYEDLLYKIMESSAALDKFGIAFPAIIASPSMSVIKAAINHYTNLLKAQPGAIKKSFFSFRSDDSAPPHGTDELTPQKVGEIIRQGFDTLSLHQYVLKTNTSSAGKTSKQDQSDASYLLYDPLPKFNESDERLFLKRMSRQVIADVQLLHGSLQ